MTEQLIINHLSTLALTVQNKSASGRGSGKKIDLYGIKKLRELILELAVRGKLVAQNPEDEPASKLLERIETEKAKLVREKKIKTQKALSAISDDEKPFSLPVNWKWRRLGEVGLVASSSRVHKKDWQSSGVPFYRAREIVQLSKMGKVDNDLFISEELFHEHSRSGLIPATNDLMITGVGTIGTPYVVRPTDRFYFKDASVLIFKNLYNLSPDFLYYFFKSPFWTDSIHKESMGTTVHTLTISRANDTLIPIAPLEEQHRIVAKVNELMALCDQIEHQTEASLSAHTTLVENLLVTLTRSANAEELKQNWQRIASHFTTLFTTEASIDQLKQTILQLAVMGKLVSFEPNTLEGELKDFISFGPRNGLSPKESPGLTAVKVLKLGATTYGELNLAESKYVDIDLDSNSHLWLKAGDILIQRGNSANYVGSNCLIRLDVEGYIYPDLMMKVRTKPELVNPEYLSILLSSHKARSFMWERMTGTSGTMPKISKKVVEEIPILIPSKQTQIELVAKIEQLFLLCNQIKSHLQHQQQTRLHLADAMVEQLT